MLNPFHAFTLSWRRSELRGDLSGKQRTSKEGCRLTRAEIWKVLADWIEELRGRFNLRTIDDLLGKVKELQKQSTQGIERDIVNSSKKHYPCIF